MTTYNKQEVNAGETIIDSYQKFLVKDVFVLGFSSGVDTEIKKLKKQGLNPEIMYGDKGESIIVVRV